MEGVFILGFIATLGGLSFAAITMTRRQRDKRRMLWSKFAISMGLDYSDSDYGIQLNGHLSGHLVSIEQSNETGTKFTVNLDLPAQNLLITSQYIGGTLFYDLGEDIEVNDNHFDAKVYLSGDTNVCIALMDATTRKLVGDLVTKHGLRITHNNIVVTRMARIADVLAFKSITRSLIEVAQRLEKNGKDIPRKLASNTQHDSLPLVRLRNLEIALKTYPKHSAIQDALNHAIDDPYPPVSVLAAGHLGTAGWSTLTGATLNRDLDTVTRKNAFEFICKNHPDPHDVVTRLFEQNFTTNDEKTLLAHAIELLRKHEVRSGLSALKSITYGNERPIDTIADMDTEVALAAVTALGRLGSPRDVWVERVAVEFLKHPKIEVKRAAAAALSLVGTTGSVEALMPYTSAGMFNDFELTTYAKKAIAAIQAQLNPNAKGHLSLSEVNTTSEGDLTLTAHSGGLTLNDNTDKAS